MVIKVTSSLAFTAASSYLIMNSNISRPHLWSSSLIAGSVSSTRSFEYVRIFTTVSMVLLSILRCRSVLYASSGLPVEKHAASLKAKFFSTYLHVRRIFLDCLEVKLSCSCGSISLNRLVAPYKRQKSGLSDMSVFLSSTHTRSMLTFCIFVLNFSMALKVLSSIVNPSCAEKRIARIIRRASSVNLSTGFPTHRIILLLISSMPPYSSTRPILSLYAIALMVKSLLQRSSVSLSENSTDEGCLPSR